MYNKHSVGNFGPFVSIADRAEALPEHAKRVSWPEPCLILGFSLLSPLEFFVVPKNGDGRNNKPPAMRVRVDCYTKNHLSVYNRVVQAVLQKGKVIYGEERKFTCAYEMDVQISYRLHT